MPAPRPGQQQPPAPARRRSHAFPLGKQPWAAGSLPWDLARLDVAAPTSSGRPAPATAGGEGHGGSRLCSTAHMALPAGWRTGHDTQPCGCQGTRAPLRAPTAPSRRVEKQDCWEHNVKRGWSRAQQGRMGTAGLCRASPSHAHTQDLILSPRWGEELVGNGFYFTQGMPSPSHTLRPNISGEDLKRQWSQKGWEGKGRSSVPPSCRMGRRALLAPCSACLAIQTATKQQGTSCTVSEDQAPSEANGQIGMDRDVHGWSPPSALPANTEERRLFITKANRPGVHLTPHPYPSCLHQHNEQHPHLWQEKMQTQRSSNAF